MVQCSTYSVARVDGTWWVEGCILRFLKRKDELPPNGWSGAVGAKSIEHAVLDERARDRRSGMPRSAMQGWKAC